MKFKKHLDASEKKVQIIHKSHLQGDYPGSPEDKSQIRKQYGEDDLLNKSQDHEVIYAIQKVADKVGGLTKKEIHHLEKVIENLPPRTKHVAAWKKLEDSLSSFRKN